MSMSVINAFVTFLVIAVFVVVLFTISASKRLSPRCKTMMPNDDAKCPECGMSTALNC
jgi:hypothetical protein